MIVVYKLQVSQRRKIKSQSHGDLLHWYVREVLIEKANKQFIKAAIQDSITAIEVENACFQVKIFPFATRKYVKYYSHQSQNKSVNYVLEEISCCKSCRNK